MGKREDYIKQILSGYETPVDIPSTWVELEKLLDPPEKKKKPLWLWLALLALLISLGLATYFYTTSNKQSANIPSHTFAQDENKAIQNDTPLAISKTTELNATNAEAINKANVDDSAESLIVSSKEIYHDNASDDVHTNQASQQKDIIGFGHISSIKIALDDNTKVITDIKQNENVSTVLAESDLSISPSSVEAENIGQTEMGLIDRAISPAVSVAGVALGLAYPEFNLQPNMVSYSNLEEDNAPIIPIQNSSKFFATLEGGPIRHSLTTSVAGDTNADALAGAELIGLRNEVFLANDMAMVESVTGYNIGSSLSYHFDNGLMLTTGLYYQAFRSRIEGIYSNSVTQSDSNATVIFSNSAGEFAAAFNDPNIAVNQTREFTHYNHLNIIHLPLQLGYKFRIKDWLLTTSAGLGVNMISNASGRYYTNPSVVGDITKDEPYNQSSLHYTLQGELGLHRKLTDRMSLFTALKAGQYLSDISPFPESKTNFKYTSLNFGLSYNL